MPGDYDVVVVGAGTAGCYAAMTACDNGLDVALLERKSRSEAGHIACGDALKGSETFPDTIDKERIEESFTNPDINQGVFELPDGERIEIPIPGELSVLDRKKYGEILIEETESAGVDIFYNSPVKEVRQNDEISGVEADIDGDPVSIDADITIDAAGALSVLQETADFSNYTFDTNVNYKQFCSAYREIITVDEDVDWGDSLVFKPTDRAAGYLWYFPRTATEINAGVGFQMDEEPMELVEVLKKDLRNREEFTNASVKDKLGAALPTRRPYDSAVAPGYIAVGDAAGHVNPTTGGGIAGAAYAGKYAGETAAEAINKVDVGEDSLWRYNIDVMDEFGARYAALDAYNIFITAHDSDEIMGLFSSLPGKKISEALYEGSADIGLGLKLRIAISSFGYWGLLLDMLRTKSFSEQILDIYKEYPSSSDGFSDWRERRDDVMESLYRVTGANPKY